MINQDGSGLDYYSPSVAKEYGRKVNFNKTPAPRSGTQGLQEPSSSDLLSVYGENAAAAADTSFAFDQSSVLTQVDENPTAQETITSQPEDENEIETYANLLEKEGYDGNNLVNKEKFVERVKKTYDVAEGEDEDVVRILTVYDSVLRRWLSSTDEKLVYYVILVLKYGYIFRFDRNFKYFKNEPEVLKQVIFKNWSKTLKEIYYSQDANDFYRRSWPQIYQDLQYLPAVGEELSDNIGQTIIQLFFGLLEEDVINSSSDLFFSDLGYDKIRFSEYRNDELRYDKPKVIQLFDYLSSAEQSHVIPEIKTGLFIDVLCMHINTVLSAKYDTDYADISSSSKSQDCKKKGKTIPSLENIKNGSMSFCKTDADGCCNRLEDFKNEFASIIANTQMLENKEKVLDMSLRSNGDYYDQFSKDIEKMSGLQLDAFQRKILSELVGKEGINNDIVSLLSSGQHEYEENNFSRQVGGGGKKNGNKKNKKAYLDSIVESICEKRHRKELSSLKKNKWCTDEEKKLIRKQLDEDKNYKKMMLSKVNIDQNEYHRIKESVKKSMEKIDLSKMDQEDYDHILKKNKQIRRYKKYKKHQRRANGDITDSDISTDSSNTSSESEAEDLYPRDKKLFKNKFHNIVYPHKLNKLVQKNKKESKKMRGGYGEWIKKMYYGDDTQVQKTEEKSVAEQIQDTVTRPFLSEKENKLNELRQEKKKKLNQLRADIDNQLKFIEKKELSDFSQELKDEAATLVSNIDGEEINTLLTNSRQKKINKNAFKHLLTKIKKYLDEKNKPEEIENTIVIEKPTEESSSAEEVERARSLDENAIVKELEETKAKLQNKELGIGENLLLTTRKYDLEQKLVAKKGVAISALDSTRDSATAALNSSLKLIEAESLKLKDDERSLPFRLRNAYFSKIKQLKASGEIKQKYLSVKDTEAGREYSSPEEKEFEESMRKDMEESRNIGTQYNYENGEEKIDVTAINENSQEKYGTQDSLFVNVIVELEEVIEKPQEDTGGEKKEETQDELFEKMQVLDVYLGKDVSVDEFFKSQEESVPFIVSHANTLTGNALKWPGTSNTGSDFSGKEYIECKDDAPTAWQANGYCKLVKEPDARTFIKVLVGGAPVLVLKPDWFDTNKIEGTRIFKLVDTKNDVNKFMALVFSTNCSVTHWDQAGNANFTESGGAEHCNQTQPQKVYYLRAMELSELRELYALTKVTVNEKRIVQYIVREMVIYEEQEEDNNDELGTAYRQGKLAIKKLYNANAKEEIQFVRKHTIEYVNKTDNGVPKVILDYSDQTVELQFLKVKESLETKIKNMGLDCYDANGDIILPLSVKCAGVLKSKQELIKGMAEVEKTKQELITEGKIIGKTLWQKIVDIFDPAPTSFIQQLWVLLLEVLEKAVRYFFAMDYAKDKLWEKLNDDNSSYFTRALALAGYPAVTAADYMLKTFMYLLRHPRVITALLKYFETMRDSVCRWFKLKWYSFWKSRGKSPEEIDQKQIQIRNQNNEERKKWYVDIKENFLLFNDAMVGSLPEGSKVGQLMGGFGTFLVGIPVIGPTFSGLLSYLAAQVPGAAKNIMDMFFIRSGFGRLISFFNVMECVSGELRVDERFYIMLKVGKNVETDYGILKNMLKLSDDLFGRKQSRGEIELAKKKIQPSTGTYAETENEEKEKQRKEIEQRLISSEEFDDAFELENREYYTVESLAMAIVKSEEEYCYKNEEIDDPRYANSKEKQYKDLKLLRQEIRTYQAAETRSLLEEIINKVQEKMRTLISIENIEKKDAGKEEFIVNPQLEELYKRRRELEQELTKYTTEPGSKILAAVTRKAEIEKNYKKSLSIVRIRENRVKELKEMGLEKRTAAENQELEALQEELDNCVKNSLDINDYEFYSNTIKIKKEGDKIPMKDDLKKYLYEEEIAEIIKVNVENILNDDVRYVKFGAYFYNNWVSKNFQPGSWFFNDKMIYLTERVYRFFNRFHELGVSSTLWASIFGLIAANVQNIAIGAVAVGTAVSSVPIPAVSAVGTGVATLGKLILSSKYVIDLLSLGVMGIGDFVVQWLDSQKEAAGEVNTVDYIKTQINMSTRTFFGIALFSTTFDELYPAMIKAAEDEKERFGEENKLSQEELLHWREEARKQSGTSEIYTIKTFSEYVFSLNKRVSRYNDFVNLKYTKENQITYQDRNGKTFIVGKGAVNSAGQLVDDKNRLINEEGYLIINGKVTDHRSEETEINKTILIQPSDFYYEIDTAAQGKRSILTDEELKGRVEEESLNLLREMEKEEIERIIKSKKEDSEINAAPVSVGDLLSGVVLTDNILFVEKGKQITITNPDKTFNNLDDLLKSSQYEKLLQAVDSFLLFFNAELTETYVEHNLDLNAAVSAAELSYDNPLNDWFLLQRLSIISSKPERNEERLYMELHYRMLDRRMTISDRIDSMLSDGWWKYLEIEDYTDQENDNNYEEAYEKYKEPIDNLIKQIFQERELARSSRSSLKTLKDFTDKGRSLKLLYQQISYKSKILAIAYYYICELLFKHMEGKDLKESEVRGFLDDTENVKVNEWIRFGQMTRGYGGYYMEMKRNIYSKVRRMQLYKDQIKINNDYITYASGVVEDQRKMYKDAVLKMRADGTYSSKLAEYGRILDISFYKNKAEQSLQEEQDEFYIIPPSLRYLRGQDDPNVRLGDLALSTAAQNLRGLGPKINIDDKNFVFGIAKAVNNDASSDELFVGGLSVPKRSLLGVLQSTDAIKSAIVFMRNFENENMRYKGYTMFLTAFYIHLTHQPNLNKTMDVQSYGSAKSYRELDALFEDDVIDKTIEDNREVICSSLLVSIIAKELFFPWNTDPTRASGQQYLIEKDYQCMDIMLFLDFQKPVYNNNNNFLNFMQYERTGDYKRSTNYYDETATSLPYTLKSGDIIPIMNEMLIKGSTKLVSDLVEEERPPAIPTTPPPTTPRPGSNATATRSNATATSPELIRPTVINPNPIGTPVSSVKQRAQQIQQQQQKVNRGGKSKRLIRAPDEVKKTMSVPRVVRSGTLRKHVTTNNANKTLKIHSLS